MKARILLLILTAFALPLLSQPSRVRTDFGSDTNTIVRDWNHSYFVAYTHENDDQSAFLLIDKSSNHIVSARLVDGYNVADFDIMDGSLYFVGSTRQQSGLMGYFDIAATFAQQDSIHYCLPNVASLPVRDDAISSMAFFRNFGNMAVFQDNERVTHVVFVGDEHVSTQYTEIRHESTNIRCLFDWVPGDAHFKMAYLSGSGEYYDDIIVCGDHLVSVARLSPQAGTPSLISYRIFNKSSSPLHSSRMSFSQDDNLALGRISLVKIQAVGLDFGALYRGVVFNQTNKFVVDLYSVPTDLDQIMRQQTLVPDLPSYRVTKGAAFVGSHKTICALYGTGDPFNPTPTRVVQFDLRSYPFANLWTDETDILAGSSITATDEAGYIVSGNHVDAIYYAQDTLFSSSDCFDHPDQSLFQNGTEHKTPSIEGQLMVGIFLASYRSSIPETTEQDGIIRCN